MTVRPSRSRVVRITHDGVNSSSISISRMQSTSPSAGAIAGWTGAAATIGCSRKPLTGMSSGVRAPSTSISSIVSATSSCASRSAARSNVSPGSTTPPGSDTCPPCRSSLWDRTVSTMCAASAMVSVSNWFFSACSARSAFRRSRGGPGNTRSNPAALRMRAGLRCDGHALRGTGAIPACAFGPGSS